MKTLLLAASAAAIALSAGALAASQASAAPTVAGPKQPIPYSQLNAYMKASPKARASKDWWSGQQASADTGAAANTSATAPAPTPSLPADTGSSATTSANPPSLGGETKEASPQLPPGPVNPPSAAPGSPPDATTPPK